MKNPRINVTFEETIASLLSQIAQQENTSLASLVRALTLEALELREDFYLSKMAEKRDAKDTEIYAHDDAWQ